MSLLSAVGKTIVDGIVQRIQSIVKNAYWDLQLGYRTGRGTTDRIFTACQLMGEARKKTL